MFSIHSLFKAVQSWRRRRGGPKTTNKRSDIALERLDHRQLMAVNLTGNAIIDIPATGQPGTVILQGQKTAAIPDDLQPIIKVSGFDLVAIRMNYSPNDDVLTVGLQSPDNQKTGQMVIAGDADNNGNGGTVDQAVTDIDNTFLDLPFLGGSESMGAFLDLNNDGIPDVVAGIARGVGQTKLYQVADAIVNPDPALAANETPVFGAPLINNTGASFLKNDDPNAPNFEFQITNFSQLYQTKTGQPFQTNSVIKVGAFGGSLVDDGINEPTFALQNVNFGVVPPVPTPPEECPVSPPVFVNPHLDHHVNTAHPTDVRVSVLGNAQFNTRNIIESSVRIGGAVPLYSFARNIDNNGFLDRTFVFRGSDIDLPRGKTRAIVTGTLTDGTTFRSGEPIFNRNDSFYTKEEIADRNRRQARQGFDANNPPPTPSQKLMQVRGNAHDLAMDEVLNNDDTPFSAVQRNTIRIATRKSASAVTIDSGYAHTMASGVGTPAGTQTASSSLLAASAKRAPVQETPSTVKIARRKSVVVPQTTASETTKPAPKGMAGMFHKAGWNRATRPMVSQA